MLEEEKKKWARKSAQCQDNSAHIVVKRTFLHSEELSRNRSYSRSTRDGYECGRTVPARVGLVQRLGGGSPQQLHAGIPPGRRGAGIISHLKALKIGVEPSHPVNQTSQEDPP